MIYDIPNTLFYDRKGKIVANPARAWLGSFAAEPKLIIIITAEPKLRTARSIIITALRDCKETKKKMETVDMDEEETVHITVWLNNGELKLEVSDRMLQILGGHRRFNSNIKNESQK